MNKVGILSKMRIVAVIVYCGVALFQISGKLLMFFAQIQPADIAANENGIAYKANSAFYFGFVSMYLFIFFQLLPVPKKDFSLRLLRIALVLNFLIFTCEFLWAVWNYANTPYYQRSLVLIGHCCVMSLFTFVRLNQLTAHRSVSIVKREGVFRRLKL